MIEGECDHPECTKMIGVSIIETIRESIDAVVHAIH